MQKNLKIIITIIILILIITGVWYGTTRKSHDLDEFITFVERNIPAEHESRLTAQIANSKAEIGDRVGDKKSMEDLERWIGIGSIYYTLGNLAEARAATLEALDVNPVNYVAWGNLGDILAEMTDLDGAEQAYQKAMELNPISIYYTKYADFLHDRVGNRLDDYEAVLKKAVEKIGQEPEFISRLAYLYMDQERYADAVAHYEVLISLTPSPTIRDELMRARALLSHQQAEENQQIE